MGMRAAVLLLVVSVSLTEAGCIPTTSPLCYKNSTSEAEDFFCEWDKRNSEENQSYTLYIQDSETKSILSLNASTISQKYITLEVMETTNRKRDIWVQTQAGNLKCNSSKISVIPQCMVKYSEPQIIGMRRSGENLFLNLNKTEDSKSVIYEIRWRENGSKWQNTIFETEENSIQDLYMLHLHNQTVYQIQLRRQAKLQAPCEDSLPLWSNWSPVKDIPLEIRQPPEIRLVKEKKMNGSRQIELTWDAPSAEESFGGVKYNVNLSVWSCKKPNGTMNLTYYNVSFQTVITYSAARISINASNSVGSSPSREIIISAVKHQKECVIFSNITKALKMKTCLEWYTLEDGQTEPRRLHRSGNKKIDDIKEEVEEFVRHYYMLHTFKERNYHRATSAMCPFYSKEGAPIKGPGNVNISNVTHESAVVQWLPIPVPEQRGFLKNYVIWISEKGNTKLHKVSAHNTSFFIQNLHQGTSYTVSIAGRTNAGTGPNATVNFETHSEEKGLSWQDQTILSVCMVAILCTIICSIVVRRYKEKLFPVVPSPVIDTAEFRYPQDQQDMSGRKEEVHEFIILQRQDHSKSTENVMPEQSTLLHDFGLVVFEEENEEGEVTDFSSMKSCIYPNPSYRGKTNLLEPFAFMTDPKDEDTESTYRNGLFFETKVLECDRTSL